MRRTILLFAVAVLAVTVVLPGLGIGQPTISHGGTPSDVYATTYAERDEDPFPCAVPRARDKSTLRLQFTTDVEANVFVSFSYEWAGLGVRETGHMYAVLHSTALEPEWLESPAYRTDGSRQGYSAGTLTWMFNDIPAGDQNLGVNVRVSAEDGLRPKAGVNGCSLTAVVIPATLLVPVP